MLASMPSRRKMTNVASNGSLQTSAGRDRYHHSGSTLPASVGLRYSLYFISGKPETSDGGQDRAWTSAPGAPSRIPGEEPDQTMPTRSDHDQLDDRKAAILKSVVTGYVETAQPVGSSQVARDPVIEVSPATVRVDMAALEREGYLTHPHTTAGRIPTDKGYRFFVDHLGSLQPLARAEHEQVQVFFSRAHGELERVLQDTSRLLAQLTDCAAVVVSPAHEVLVVRSALIARLAARTAMVVAVLS